ncbi:MAG: diguanylate cyclase [Pirellulaceae bacterium]|nr:diguanylate cyclase [Pirellulaceae bacterium]
MVEKGTILLVEDDRAMSRLIRKWLECDGWNVLMAEDGQQAMELVTEHQPNIVVTDWDMPIVDGLEFCRWLRKQPVKKFVYVMMMTVRASPPEQVEGLNAGADAFLKKPVDRTELLAKLDAAKRIVSFEHELTEQANSDSLTGLSTRPLFSERMEVEWNRADRHHIPLSLVMLDIDYFKRVNDTHGHPVGDEVIKMVAKTLCETCRASDLVCRYGGEEFAALLPETDEHHAIQWAERIRDAVREKSVAAGDRRINVTVSFGVAQRLADTANGHSLIDLADQALLVAKRTGRDRVVGYRTISASNAPSADAAPTIDLLARIPARDVMTTIVAGIGQDEFVGRAAKYFLRFRINSAPVVDEEGKLVGVLSEKDVMSIMLCPKWWETRIRDVMKTDVVSYTADTSALAIYEFLCRVAIRGVVIVDDGRPTGVISRGSILRWFTNCLAVGIVKIPDADADALREIRPERDLADFQVNPIESLLAAVNAMGSESAELQQRLRANATDLLPCIVGGASRIQELVNDVLACSRVANETQLAVDSGDSSEWLVD